MIINLGGWSRDDEDRLFEGETSEALSDFSDPLVRLRGPLRYRLVAHLADKELLVRGRLDLAVSARCGRCGEWRDAVFSEPGFLRSFQVETLHDVINLTDEIREGILLSFPSSFVCSSSCKGVCPMCGTNLNQAACSCKPRGGHDGWGALDALQIRPPDHA